jgi:hypothetical protein
MRRRGLLALALIACLAAPAQAVADNDDWEAAEDLYFATTGTAITGTYGEQAVETLSSTGCPMMGKTAWWRITGNGQDITLSTAVTGTNFNTVLAVMQGTPLSGSRIACNDNASGDPLLRSTVTFPSVNGRAYLVQVGGRDSCSPTLEPCPGSGTVVVSAASQRPVNDDRASAAALTTGVPLTSTNVGASLERDEDASCGASRFAATVWYQWTAPGTGEAVFASTASFAAAPGVNRSDTVLAVHRKDSGARIGCADDFGQAFGPSTLVAAVTAGDYLLQVGARIDDTIPIGQGNVEGRVAFAPDGDGDGATTLTDCDDGNPGIRPGARDVAGNGVDEDCNGTDAPLDPLELAAAADSDRDGYPKRVDCDDEDPARNPGARDVPGDGIDQDCVGGDAAFPKLDAAVLGAWRSFAGYTTFTDLVVRRVPAHGKVTIRCKGDGCPFKVKTRRFKKAKARADVLGRLDGARLRRGAKLQVRVLKRRHIGIVAAWAIRAPAVPKRTDRCLVPGRGRPSRC